MHMQLNYKYLHFFLQTLNSQLYDKHFHTHKYYINYKCKTENIIREHMEKSNGNSMM